MNEPAPTRIDAVDSAGAAPTRVDGAPPRTPARSLYNLPAALAEHWRIARPIPAGGAEAELAVVERIDGGGEAVAKLYRPGMPLPSAALERLTGALAEHVVNVYARGESDGIAYELMEYCRFGSLRDRLREAGTPDPAFARAVLAEVAPAIAALHDAGLIHRDLKPANVLVRALDPLDLVLADFGIASLAEATQHFTSTSRTLAYAAPEAMSGVLSYKCDYWSLGMMLVELLTGRHPFQGLSEAVINHQLITRSVSVDAIGDPRWRALVRGLLLRDPQTRWGAEEVRRWLADDPSLDLERLAVDTAVAHAAARPYLIESEACATAEALALALVRHWPTGVKDLARGFVLNWVRQELRDQNLERFLLDLADDASATPDVRLLRFALRVVPRLPANWKGTALADDALRERVLRAIGGDAGAADHLGELYRADVLRLFTGTHPDAARLQALGERWRARVGAYRNAESRLREAERAARSADAGLAGVADFDALVFGRNGQQTLDADPAPHALLLAPDFAPQAIEAMRSRVAAAAIELASSVPWLSAVGDPATVPVETLAALAASLPRAREFAAEIGRRREARAAERARDAQALRDEIDALLGGLHGLARDPLGTHEARIGLRDACDRFDALHAKALAQVSDDPVIAVMQRLVKRAAPHFATIHEATDRLDHLDRLRALVTEQGLAILAAMIFIPLVFRLLPLLAIFGGAALIALGWYFLQRGALVERLGKAVDRLPRRVPDPEPVSSNARVRTAPGAADA